MKISLHSLPLLILFGMICVPSQEAQAQESVVASGGNATGEGGSVSFTVGQVVYGTFSGSNASISQGVQQPYEITAITGIEQKEIQLDFVVYPNPTENYLKLEIGANIDRKMIFQLFGSSGNLLQERDIVQKETLIDVSDYPPAVYYLLISNENRELKSFIIIKN